MDLTNVSKNLNEKAFLNATIAQIQKDFHSIGVEIELNSLNGAELATDLTHELQDLSPEQWIQLAYTVDIGEDKLRNWMAKSGELDELSKLVIYREAFKVYIRNTRASIDL
jgi:hypothetical protein